MGDLLLRSLPMCLAPAPIGGFRRYRMAMRRRFGGGSGIWGLCRKRSVRAGASDLELIYSTESSDGSVLFRFGTSSEIADYVALKEAESEGVVALFEDGTLQENIVTCNEEETAKGLADEVLETQLHVKDVEKSALEMESEVPQAEDGILEENIVSDGTEENVEGFSNEVANTNLCVEMQRDKNVCTSGSSENLSRVQVGSDYGGVSDSFNLILDEPVERLSIYEDKDGRVPMEKVSVVENIMSNEIVADPENTMSTSDYVGHCGGDFEHTLGIENISAESISVLGDNLESNLEVDNVNGSSADDFGGNVGDDNTCLENSNYSYENANGDELKESMADLDRMAPEPDVEARLSMDEASSYVDKEKISSHSIDESIYRFKKGTVPISETIEVLGSASDSNGNIELSTVVKTTISTEDLECDDKVIAVNGTLTSNEEMAWDSDNKYVDLHKTSTSDDVRQENTRDDVSVVGQPSANNVFNQKDSSQTSDAASSLISIAAASLTSTEDGYSDKTSKEINMIQKKIDIATISINQEDTDGYISVETIPVPSQVENENIVEERISFDSEEGFLSKAGIDNLNLLQAAENATTNELIKISESDILRDSATDISVSKAAEHIPARVADREKTSSVRLCLSIGATLLPKTLEALAGGEDAYFIAGDTWFGVADGEGQWSLEGIDAGLYGHELMEYCRRIVSDISSLTTKEVLCRSAAEATLPGSATILLANFDGQVLHALNIGDTGFVIARNGAIMSRSMPTVHDFHFPHQIQKGDDPLEFVEVYEIELDEGDIIVAATDGLFDNMYDQEIASIVTKSLQGNLSPEEVAAVLAVKAQEIGRSTSARSPFADEAKAAGYAGFTGGKLDDVAVIVSVVQKKP